MKHLSRVDLELLDGLLREAELAVPDDARTSLAAYLDGVIEQNLSLNLTRIADPAGGVRLHVLDSLLALPEVADAPAGPLLDIGTGGGFPGVPLCITSKRAGVLLDSVGKKSRAVNAVLDTLGLSEAIVAVHERAEDHARASQGTYAVVTARAVAELPVLVELASPLLCIGGRLVAFKGAPEEDELVRGRLAADLVGMAEVSVRRVLLPGGDERRCLVVYERIGGSRTLLPRRPGEARRSPLA